MPLSRVRISALRCLAEAELVLDPTRNYIYGANGAGKTSILEALFLLGRGRSFRTRQIHRLVRRGEQGLTVYGEVGDGPRTRRIGVGFSNGSLEKKLDGRDAKSAELAEVLPVQAMDPSSHELIQGGPSERRRLLDWGVFHVEHRYLEAWRRYRRLLGQRNAALKTHGAAPAQLAVWTEELANVGQEIDGHRAAYVARLAPSVLQSGEALLGQPLTIEYRRGWRKDLSLAEALAATDARDRMFGNTEAGPHRADVVVYIDGRRVEDEASRGQQKLVAAALILGQESVLSEIHRGRSVLLVDDPAAELDAIALDRLLDVLSSVRSQLVFTGLTPLKLPSGMAAALFHVERGQVRTV